MTSDFACRQNMERELAPDLLPPVAWSEKQRLLTKLVQPVTPVEVCAAVLEVSSERASEHASVILDCSRCICQYVYHHQVCKTACMRACPVRIALAPCRHQPLG